MSKKTVQDVVRDVLQKYFMGQDFKGLHADIEQKNLLLQGECMKRLGENAVYDIDSQSCLDCAKTKCTNDDACMALCTNVHRNIKLAEDNLSLQAKNNELYIIGIVALVTSLLILFIFIVYRVNKYWRSRTDIREAPDSDTVPQVLEVNEEARTFIDTTAQQPLTENERAV